MHSMNLKELQAQREKKKMVHDLHAAVKNRQEYDAQERLEDMREKRRRAEMGIQYLKAHQKRR